jgi:hypothetical protein
MIKDKTIRAEKKGGKLRWAVCTDGSDKSIQAFHVLAKLIDKTKDEVVAITVQSKGLDVAEIQAKIQSHFEQEGVSIANLNCLR